MNVLFDFLRRSFSSHLAYRANLFGHVAVLIFTYGTRLLVLGGLFQYTNNLAGWTQTEATLLLYVTLLAGLSADIFDVSVLQFYRQVALGTIQPFLTKPVNPYILMLARWSKPSSFIVLLVFLPLSFFFFYDLPTLPVHHWLLFFLTFCCGVICNVIFVSLLSMSTFIIQRTLPVEYIYSEVFRLCPYPLNIYPKASLGVLVFTIPSIFCASLPAYVLLRGGIDFAVIFLLATIFLTIAHHFSFRFMMRRYESFGG